MLSLNYSTVADPLLQDIRILIPKFTGMKEGTRGLDVCCGTGDQVFYYSKQGITATGIDSSLVMIDIAKRKKERLGINNIFFHVGDARKLPFEDNYFDFASMTLGMHEIIAQERNKAISEMKRVVKPEGFLVFVDFRVPLPRNIITFLIRGIEHLAAKDRYENFQSYIDEGGLLVLLKRSGLIPQKTAHLKLGTLLIIKAQNNKSHARNY